MLPRSDGDSALPVRASEGRRAGRGRLTRDEVMAAAVELIDSEGLDRLTMRRLGQRVGRDAMSLYRYAPNRDGLLDEVVESVLSELPPFPGERPWQEELRDGAHAFRRVALAHPHVVPLLVTRPLKTPLGLRPLSVLRHLEGFLTLLIGQGFTPGEALRAYRSYMVLLSGHILNELQEAVVDEEETIDLLRLGLHRLPVKDFPTIRGLADILATYDGAAELDRGLDNFLRALEAERHPAHIAGAGARPAADEPNTTHTEDPA